MAGESNKEKRRNNGIPSPSSVATHNRMKAAKPSDTAPEMALRSALQKKGVRFLTDIKPVKELNRTADIVFQLEKIAIFVDGCFWHGCPIHGTKAKSNAEFWNQKIKRNQERDCDTTNNLKAAGWTVIRVWEHELTAPDMVAERIISLFPR